MIIRNIDNRDIARLMDIHSRFFANEFPFPDFFQGFLTSFVVESPDGIITAGGVRPIAEMIMITDKDRNVHDKRLALIQALDAAEYVCKKMGFNEIHAFVQNPLWEGRLKRTGFQPTKGHSLVLQLD